ncbi:5-formyltetrahydrofolate cyclo-ligase [Companilactobacillus metriopterae]|uniref:5-formyltetrahydrofolate cyclo-ligase n=1 Tax=Companilactobacillus metriopterae TaxID=1909267 RepID=UPI00100AF453|nr:5-formyltetrahydrofolate cyclo-ligase [Companilactobacillus metriopterae]
MDKVSFRKKQMDLLDDFLSSNESQKEINQIYSKLFDNPTFIKSETIGITLSMSGELPTLPIVETCWNMGKEVYIPKTYQDYSMDFVKYTKSTILETSSFGVKEPIAAGENVLNPPDLIIVPGLAFSDNEHARLGFGAGYFDRYLSKYPTKTISLALSRQFYINTPWPVYSLDQPIDEIISVSKEK